MESCTVPDFFQSEDEDSLRERAEWLDKNLGLDAAFLAKIAEMKESEVREWRDKIVHLPPEGEQNLRELWYVVLHLLSHYNNQAPLVRKLLEEDVSPKSESPLHPIAPPWIHSSLKEYLGQGGIEAINEVNRWIMSLRFGDPYSRSRIWR